MSALKKLLEEAKRKRAALDENLLKVCYSTLHEPEVEDDKAMQGCCLVRFVWNNVGQKVHKTF